MGNVLIRQPLREDEDFFDCGGDSVAAVEFLQQLVDEPQLARLGALDDLQAALLEAIFEDASPAALAQVCAAHAGTA